MSSDPIVILSYARTPMGSFQGSLAGATTGRLEGKGATAAAPTSDLAQGVLAG